MNLYLNASGAPTYRIDPLGLDAGCGTFGFRCAWRGFVSVIWQQFGELITNLAQCAYGAAAAVQEFNRTAPPPGSLPPLGEAIVEAERGVVALGGCLAKAT